MKIVETLAEYDAINKGITYIKSENIKVWHGGGQIRFTDLTNAHKRGKECFHVSISNRHLSSHGNDYLNHILVHFNDSIVDLMNHYRVEVDQTGKDSGKFIIEEGLDKGVEVYTSFKPSLTTFSPFNLAQFKPLKDIPKKWRLSHAIKVVANNQFTNLRCKYRYTDDHAFDAAHNNQKRHLSEEEKMNFLKNLVEEQGGYSQMRIDLEENNVLEFYEGFRCHALELQLEEVPA